MRAIEGVSYASKDAYTKFADEKKLSREDLQSVYESIHGAPKVKRLRNRPYAIERIWDTAPEVTVVIPMEVPTILGDSKKAMVLRMIEGPGATLENIASATGWARHTTRGFLSTLRSKGGFDIVSTREGKTTTYRLNGVIDQRSVAGNER